MSKYIYFFGGGKAEGNAKMKDLLGGKGANLAEMTNLKIPVPPGFTITTKACLHFFENKQKWPAGLKKELFENLKKLEKSKGARLGDENNPLLVSVRSGAKISMPGMMDTVLNLGLNSNTLKALAKNTNNARFAYDSFRRFIQMFGNVVLGIPKEDFEELITEEKKKAGVKLDVDLKIKHLESLINQFKALCKRKTKIVFPEDPYQQLVMACNAVFTSWNNDRAIFYRKQNNIPDSLGTAVNVQAMVFGNIGDESATGVGFTRDPATGEKIFYGEYLPNAQGEDVVAGVRTPLHFKDLKKQFPQVYDQLKKITGRLEKHYRDIQDFEFTVEKGKLYLLQTRTGKRTAAAAVKIAVDMVKERLINKKEALFRIQPEQIDQLLHPILNPKAKVEVIAKGLPASPGAATGKVVFTADEAAERGNKEKIILVRNETCPDDIHGMAAAQGILTARGGMTSHAAVVARGMGKCCVAGCESIKADEKGNKFSVGKRIVKRDDYITLDGSTGRVILGMVPTVQPSMSGAFGKILSWADEVRRLGIRANADIPRDAKTARDFGAEGIGLCRTEHMFFAKDRIPLVQKMILARTTEERQKSLNRLLPLQEKDFEGLFEAMKGYPVTIRLLDPPLHEFLPRREELMVEIALLKKEKRTPRKVIEEKEKLLSRIEELHEFNPMLGHRGCRLGITYPEISKMQVRAIFQAACRIIKKGKKIYPEVMIPLVSLTGEFQKQKELVDRTAQEVMKKEKVTFDYMVGTMIELPRATVIADKIAETAEFFSFGTNDLTQTTFGFSRDDAGKFIRVYRDLGILSKDPFQNLDIEGVGKLIKMAVEKGRKKRPKLKVGICGEHGGDPASIQFCETIGMNYVSCSPYRVPIARLAAAQASLTKGRKK